MEHLIIGIAGPSAGGKTSVTNKIVENLEEHSVCVINLDDYYKDQSNLSFSQRQLVNYDHPNAFDTKLLIDNINDLISGKIIEKPIYDFVNHNRSEKKENVKPTQIIIVEGLFSLYYEDLYKLFDIKIYVDADSDLCFIRRLKRDTAQRGRTIDSVIEQYTSTVKPMYQQFIRPTKDNAHIIIPNGGENSVAVEIVQKIINDHLQGEKNE